MKTLFLIWLKCSEILGHTVITSYDAGQAKQSIPDNVVLDYATRNNLAIITFNRDDFIELHNTSIQHSGIIICKTDRNYQGQVNFLLIQLTKISQSSTCINIQSTSIVK